MKKMGSAGLKSLLSSFAAGAIVTLALVAAFKGIDFSGDGAGPGRVLAQMDGEKLKEGQLRGLLGNDLIPIESDQYAAYSRGINRWLREKLLEKEARAQGLSVQDLTFKKVWDYVRVSSSDVADYYQKNKDLYNQPLERIQDLLFKMLREREYGRVEEKLMDELRQKYHAKILLEKPKNYVEGAVLPPPSPALAPAPGQVQAAPPSVAGQAPSAPRPPAPPTSAMDPNFKMTPSDLAGQPSQGPENAPVLLVEFSDFHCAFCGKVSPTINDLMKSYDGKIRRVWMHNPLAMHPEAPQTAVAAECALEQGKFWEYHDKLFEKTGSFKTDEALIGLARETGLKEDAFKGCLSSGKYRDKVAKNLTVGGKLGVRGTPNFFVNGTNVTGAQPLEKFKEAVDNALKQGGGAILPKAPEPPKPASFDDLAGRPSQGPANAPVTLVEFSDFHCPFCSKVEASVNDVMKNYAGKVRRVWRHYPLSFHAGADQTAEASECAAEQGKFWEYHDKLFEKTGTFKGDDAFIGLAKELKLDEKKFTDCVKSRKYKDVVLNDSKKGSSVGVNGTPHFFINGKPLSGAQPYNSFAQAIDAELAKK